MATKYTSRGYEKRSKDGTKVAEVTCTQILGIRHGTKTIEASTHVRVFQDLTRFYPGT